MSRIIYLYISIIFLSCSNSNQENFSHLNVLVDTLHFSPKDETIPSESIIDQVDFIALETNRSSVFSNIDDIIILKDRYIILDKEVNTVLVFNNDGRFITKFDDKNNGNEIKFSQIRLDKISEEIIVKDVNSFDLIFYDKNGNITRKIYDDSDYYTFTIRNKDIIFFNHYVEENKQRGDIRYLVEVKDTSKMLTKHRTFPYNTNVIYKNELVNNLKNFYYVDSTLILTVSGELKYYSLNENYDASRAYVIKLDGNKFSQTPGDFLTLKKYSGVRKSYLKNNQTQFHNIRSIFNNKTGTIYTVESKSNILNIIKTSENNLISSDDLSYDINVVPLPPISTFVIGNDEEFFYSFYNSKQFIETIGMLPIRTEFLLKYPKIDNIYKNLTHLSNPILVRFKLKKYNK